MTAYAHIKRQLQKRAACRPGMARFLEVAREHRYDMAAAAEDTRRRVLKELDGIIAAHGEDSFIPMDGSYDLHRPEQHGTLDVRYMAWLMSSRLFQPKEYRYSRHLNVHQAGQLRRKLKYWTASRILRRLLEV